MEPSSFETYASQDITKFEIYPEISYKWDALLNTIQPRPVSIKFSIIVDGKDSGQQVKTVSLRSINDCPFTFIDKNRSLVDLNFMYAAYVNETHPRIANEVLPEIINQGIISQITGYQGGEEEVYRQVFAVWNYFREKDITYSSLNTPMLELSGKDYPFVQSQYVRTFDDALNTSQANCVDGTVAMASVLYRMGIKPIITVTPSHCWLGFLADGAGERMDFLETTMLGTDFSSEDMEAVSSIVTDVYHQKLDQTDYASYRSFLIATLSGRENYHSDSERFNAYGRVDALRFINDDNQADMIDKMQYQIFTVDRYRSEGLLPIAGH